MYASGRMLDFALPQTVPTKPVHMICSCTAPVASAYPGRCHHSVACSLLGPRCRGGAKHQSPLGSRAPRCRAAALLLLALGVLASAAALPLPALGRLIPAAALVLLGLGALVSAAAVLLLLGLLASAAAALHLLGALVSAAPLLAAAGLRCLRLSATALPAAAGLRCLRLSAAALPAAAGLARRRLTGRSACSSSGRAPPGTRLPSLRPPALAAGDRAVLAVPSDAAGVSTGAGGCPGCSFMAIGRRLRRGSGVAPSSSLQAGSPWRASAGAGWPAPAPCCCRRCAPAWTACTGLGAALPAQGAAEAGAATTTRGAILAVWVAPPTLCLALAAAAAAAAATWAA